MDIRKYKHNRPTIGVLAGWQAYSGMLDSFLDHVLRGIQLAAQDHECNLMIACGVGAERELGLGRPAWPILSPEVDFVPVGHWNTDGLVVVPPLASDNGKPYFYNLIDSGFPIIFAGDRDTGPAVIVDNPGGIRQALNHLVDHGHHRIAYVAGRPNRPHEDSGIRLEAYQSAVKELGLDDDPGLIAYGFHTYAGGQKAARQLLDQGIEFSAALVSNDESAIGVTDTLHAAGLLVPQDVAVIGFDDRLEARAQIPSLTTVHFPMFSLGYQALELLIKTIEGTAEKGTLVRIPTRLVIRESCGCSAGITNNLVPAETWSQTTQGLSVQWGADHPRSRGDQAYQARFHDPALESASRITQEMISVIYNESQRLSLGEVKYFCQRLVEAFRMSLAQGSPMTFRQTIHQIIKRVSSQGDDLYAWQEAVSILREWLPTYLELEPAYLDRQQVEDILHQTLSVISEVSRGQFSRMLVRQASIADQMGQMATQFFSAQDEPEVFSILANSLPGIGIQHATVAFMQAEGEDPVASSEIRSTLSPDEDRQRYPSRQFPPEGLYPQDKPFNLALLPLHVRQDETGFVAFDSGNLQQCASILRQLEAALRGIWLYKEAIEARRLAEEGEKLAEEANRLKSRFLSMVSHELRTPLNLIYGLSDMLLHDSEPINPQKFKVDRKDLERINISAQHLDSLIRDVLDLAHSDVGQLKLVCEWLDLREILKDISVIGEQFAHDKGLTWTFEMQKNLPRVWGDGTRLRQVMLNLVTNAVKFTSCGEVGMTATAKDGFLTVGIHDTGLGISEDEQDLIFDEFRQSDRTTARGFGGLGLGLAICKRLVEMHGGEIGVYSSGEEGEGSTFYFTLPTKERPVALAPGGIPLIDYLTKPIGTAELAETLTAQGLLDKDGKNGAEKKILIVDDEPGILNLHTRIVQAQSPDYQVLQARSGLEALKIIREERPDLVLLDLMMPEVDGYAVLDAMRSEELSRDTPVIVLTGQALTDEDMVRLNVTAASVLGKGMFSVEETLNHINSALSHKRRVGPDAQRIVLKAMAYIHANYPEPISRKDVAEYVGLSERHLNRCFMQEIGISPMTYLNRFRVRQAKQLLQSGEKGITEIALDVGFTSSAYFTRVFREEVGVSPRTYLKGRCSELNV